MNVQKLIRDTKRQQESLGPDHSAYPALTELLKTLYKLTEPGKALPTETSERAGCNPAKNTADPLGVPLTKKESQNEH